MGRNVKNCQHLTPEDPDVSLIVKFVNHLGLNRAVDIFRHRVAYLLADVSHRSQCPPDQGERFGQLPRQSHVKRNSADRSGHVRGQWPAVLRLRRFADSLQ